MPVSIPSNTPVAPAKPIVNGMTDDEGHRGGCFPCQRILDESRRGRIRTTAFPAQPFYRAFGVPRDCRAGRHRVRRDAESSIK
jgi:hypothetical protein